MVRIVTSEIRRGEGRYLAGATGTRVAVYASPLDLVILFGVLFENPWLISAFRLLLAPAELRCCCCFTLDAGAESSKFKTLADNKAASARVAIPARAAAS